MLVIVGPTAVGKSDIAVLCAQKLNGEIVSADSMQIYKYMDIGTAKPDAAQLAAVRHHMLDIITPDNTFSAVEYKENASEAVLDIKGRNKLPIVVGGTGFYVNALLYPLNIENAAKSDKIRRKYEELLERTSNEQLYNILKQTDPAASEKIHPNDTKRIIRALEIYETSGKRKSENINNGISQSPDFEHRAIALNLRRELLYERINKRVDNMLESGFIEEVERLLKAGYSAAYQAMQSIGYRELAAYLNKEISLEKARDDIKQATRNYAKRQLTFFKNSMKNLIWLDTENKTKEQIVSEICSFS
jgi:tRNA dimethylallyltransferase